MLVLTLAAPAAQGDVPDFVLFLGRFHPVVIHLPIGFLLLALLFEGLARFRSATQLEPAIPLTLGMGAAFSFISSIAGLLLSLGEAYEETLVNRHMWLGFSVAIVSTAAFVLKKKQRREPSRSTDRGYVISLIGSAVLLVLAGHFGGALTHGSDYLTREMPDPLRFLFGLGPKEERSVAIRLDDVDAARLYGDIVAPILEDRCTSCHNPKKTRGELLLDTQENMLRGGESGPLFVAGDPDRSELIRRIELDEDDEDHMPEKRRSLTPERIALLRWWVSVGAPFDKRVSDVETPADIRAILDGLASGAGSSEAGEAPAVDVPPADSLVVDSLRAGGLFIVPLSETSPLLQVGCTNLAARFDDAQLRALSTIAPNVAWLDLARTGITDEGLRVLATMPNLQRLHLEYTGITDAGLAHVGQASQLSYLNLVGTRVSDAGLERLLELEKLTHLYVWRTDVTEAGADRLRLQFPEIEISVGGSIDWPEEPEVGPSE